MPTASVFSRRAFLAAASTTLIAATGSAKVITDEKYQAHAPSEGPEDLDKAPLPPGERIGIAVVGLGQLSLGQILPAFARSKTVRLAGLVSGHPDKARRLAGDYGIDPKNLYSYENFDTIKDNPDIQAVYIVLPNSMHREFTIRAAKAGKHVLCEKPMAITPEDCQAMIDACKAANVKLMIAYRIHFEPHNVRARDLFRQGAVGKPKVFVADLCQDQGDPEQWRQKRAMAGGGVMIDLGIYALNGARFLLGEEPNEVRAMTYSTPGDPRFAEVEEACHFIASFPSGAQAVCASSYGAHSSKGCRLNGETASLVLEPGIPYHGIKLKLATAKDETQYEIEDKDQFALEMDHFGDCVKNDRTPATPGEEGLRDVSIIMKIYEAAKSGTAVKV